MNVVIHRVESCWIGNVHFECRKCIQLLRMYLFHARHCKNANCVVPMPRSVQLLKDDLELAKSLRRAEYRRLHPEGMRRSNPEASNRSPGGN